MGLGISGGLTMGCAPGYRKGRPRITETMSQQDGGRSTGYFGTGVYFYTDEHCLIGKEPTDGTEDVRFEMSCPCKKPLFLSGEPVDKFAADAIERGAVAREYYEKGIKLHQLSRKMVDAVRGDEPGFAMYIYVEPVAEMFGADPDEFRQAVDEAIEATKDCLEKNGRYSSKCSQPINYLMEKYGYDCVYPKGELGRCNSHGAVLLREPLEQCLGHALTSREDIDMDELEECVGTVRRL